MLREIDAGYMTNAASAELKRTSTAEADAGGGGGGHGGEMGYMEEGASYERKSPRLERDNDSNRSGFAFAHAEGNVVWRSKRETKGR